MLKVGHGISSMKLRQPHSVVVLSTCLSGADHINAQLWELGQKAKPTPLSLGKSSYLIGCEGIVALVTIHKVGKVGA